MSLRYDEHHNFDPYFWQKYFVKSESETKRLKLDNDALKAATTAIYTWVAVTTGNLWTLNLSNITIKQKSIALRCPDLVIASYQQLSIEYSSCSAKSKETFTCLILQCIFAVCYHALVSEKTLNSYLFPIVLLSWQSAKNAL